MTRKDFELIAAAVANITQRSDRFLVRNVVANSFEKDYPRFDRYRFIAACRPTESQSE